MKVKKQLQRMRQVQYVKVKLVREETVKYPYQVSCGAVAYYGILQEVYAGADREICVVLCLDGKLKVTAINVVAVGDLEQARVHPREVFKPAILANAARIILAHNHPSGDPAPSEDDVALAKRMIAAGHLMGIKVEDFIILGEGCYYSLGEHQKALFRAVA